MPSGVEFPPGKRAEILAMLGQGRTLREIQDATGVAWQTIYGWRDKDDQFRTDYDTARQVYKRFRHELAEDRKEWVADELYKQLDDLEGDKRALLLLKLHELHARQSQKFEITGDGGGPVVIQHERRLTLADVLTAGHDLRPGLGASGELPAARPILAEPLEGQ